MYIAFEGVVGTGKSTQSQRLYESIATQNPTLAIEYVREPGGTEIAESIRRMVQGTARKETMHPLTDAYLYAAARVQLMQSRIKPVLDQGGIVIADRCFVSSLAYQGYAQGLGIEKVFEINRQALMDCIPDQILFMDLDIQVGLSRTFDADGDKREKKDADFFRTIARGYHESSKHPHVNPLWKRIDASGTHDDVYNRIIDVLRHHRLWDTLPTR